MAQQGKAAGAPAAGQPGVAMPFPLVQDVNQLSQLSGIPVPALANPAMQLAAQQLLAQRMLQQQLIAQGQARPGAAGAVPMLPQQMLALQQAQQAALQQRMAAAAAPPATKKGAGTRKRGARGAAAAAAAAPSAAAMFAAASQQPARGANPFADPGGKVVWAKVGSYPWWPAKTLDPQRDLSYPPDADPPRPTSIPIRFFGTFEFQWIGSKRALADWEEGFAQYSGGSDQASFRAAVAEAQAYKAAGKLPEPFYVTPEPAQPKAKARGGAKKRGGRGAAAPDAAAEMAAAAAAAAAGGAKAVRAAGRTAEPAEDRAEVVQRRKQQRLQDWGLLPPDNSPYTGGRVAPNPALLEKRAEWGQQFAALVEEDRQQQAAVAAARAEASAARARAAEERKAAAAAAAANTASGMFAAAMQGAVPVQGGVAPSAAVLQQQMMLQQMMMQQMQGAALPRV